MPFLLALQPLAVCLGSRCNYDPSNSVACGLMKIGIDAIIENAGFWVSGQGVRARRPTHAPNEAKLFKKGYSLPIQTRRPLLPRRFPFVSRHACVSSAETLLAVSHLGRACVAYLNTHILCWYSCASQRSDGQLVFPLRADSLHCPPLPSLSPLSHDEHRSPAR